MIYFVAFLIVAGIFFFLYQNYMAMAEFKARFDELICEKFDNVQRTLRDVNSKETSFKLQLSEIQEKCFELRSDLHVLSQDLAVMHSSLNHTSDSLTYKIDQLRSPDLKQVDEVAKAAEGCKTKCKSKRNSEAS